jgi:hypothetical protein
MHGIRTSQQFEKIKHKTKSVTNTTQDMDKKQDVNFKWFDQYLAGATRQQGRPLLARFYTRLYLGS